MIRDKFLLYYLLFSSAAALLTACEPKIPQNYWEKDELPNIYPDYANVTVPVNIAPLTFQMDNKVDNMVARLTAGEEEVIYGGNKVQPDKSEWSDLVQSALKLQPSAITVEIFIENNDQWTRYKPFSIFVSPDSIDPYISYRLISPSYVVYEDLTINQRCLENYDESVIYDNMLCSEDTKGQCINCHNYQQYNPDRMQFHARENLGGTIIAYDGTIKKVNMRNDSTLSAGVYPTWHPWLPFIVYSTNLTAQSFHTVDPNKIEVFDSQSDLIAYDVEKNEVTNIVNDPDELECFPFWAPDGKTLYYCSAHFEYKDTIDKGQELMMHYEDVKYKLYKKSFDPETKRFGPREALIIDHSPLTIDHSPLTIDHSPLTIDHSPLTIDHSPDSATNNSQSSMVNDQWSMVNDQWSMVNDMSATLPRVSPDGRFLMFTLAPYGIFHIWHHEADLWMLDLQTGEVRNMEEINSPDTESYHSWSSNGKWVVFSSRRYDGNYTRPFIAHIDSNGKGSKPFELPSADPDYHRKFLKSYNVPEFMRGPVTIKPQQFADAIKKDGETVKYKSNEN